MASYSANTQHEDYAISCPITKIPLKDVLWFCIVSVFLDVKDIAMMERAFTNKAFYRFIDDKGVRQGLFMNVDWDTSSRAVCITSEEQVNWLQRRQIRLYYIKCMRGDYVLSNIVKTCRGLLRSLDLSSYEPKSAITSQMIGEIARECGPQLSTVILSGSNVLTNISSLVSRCKGIKVLRLDSAGCMNDNDCRAIASELPELVSLDLSYCDKVSHAGLGAIASFGRLETLAISNCPRVTDTAVSALTESCPNLKRLDLGRLNISTNAVIDVAEGCKLLESLNINGCKRLGREAVFAIGQFVGARLKELFASDCAAIDEESLNCIASLCPQLQALNVSFNIRVTDSNLQELGRNCHQLRDCDFADCCQITDIGVIALATGCPILRNIRLFNVFSVTDASIEKLLLCSNLVGLDVRKCRITPYSIELAKKKATVTLLLSGRM